MFVLISYDVEDDKVRVRMAKTLEGYGTRVQYSVFECNLSEREYEALKEQLAHLVAAAETHDPPTAATVRCYRLCRACVGRIEILGEGRVTQDPDYYIV